MTGAAASGGRGISWVMTWVRWVKRGAWRRGGTTVYTKHATATTRSSARKHASSTSRAFIAADVWGSRVLGGGSSSLVVPRALLRSERGPGVEEDRSGLGSDFFRIGILCPPLGRSVRRVAGRKHSSLQGSYVYFVLSVVSTGIHEGSV